MAQTQFDPTVLIPKVLGRYSPVMVDRAEGAYIYDTDGRRWLDFTCGIAVTNTGHSHPRVVQAIQEQAAKIIHAQVNILVHEPYMQLAQNLGETFPVPLQGVFFANSGAEAIEGAVKLAKVVTRRPAVISFTGAFHGRTHLAMSLTTSRVKVRGHYEPLLASTYHAPYPYPFRNPYQGDAGEARITELERVFETQVMPDDVAAVIFEPILGEGGYIVPPTNWVRRLREICEEHGIMLIADEIQTGVGRTGKMWGFEHFDIVPDIVAVAKGIASGLPLSAVVASREHLDHWAPGAHGGTYGGNVVACAAGIATLAVIREERLLENATARGEQLMAGLDRIAERNPVIGEVRGKGLMVATEFVTATGRPNPQAVSQVIGHAIDNRLLLLTCGTYDQAIRIIPPLTISAEQIDEFLMLYQAAVESVG